MLPEFFKRTLSLLLLLITCFSLVSQAQNIGDWTAHPSYRSVWGLAEDANGTIWAATGGGLFGIADNSLLKLTTVDGLYRFRSNAITYDPVTNSIWLGYDDGMLQQYNIDTGAIRNVNDIHRATSFNPRGVNQLRMKGDTLLVATDFGLVLYDVQRRITIDTYRGFGNFPLGTRVNTVFTEGDMFYLATAQGVAIGNGRVNNLIVPSSWVSYGGNTILGTGEVFSVVAYKGFVYANRSTNKFRFNGTQWQTWSEVPGTFRKIQYDEREDRLIFVRNHDVVLFDGQNAVTVDPGFFTETREALVGADSEVYIATSESGVMIYRSASDRTLEFPEGPFMNLFTGLNVSEGVLITGTTRSGGGERLNAFSGYNIFSNGEWRTFNTYLTPELQARNFNNVISAFATRNYFYFGSEGGGVARHRRSDDEIQVFNEGNSSLVGFGPSYFVASGFAQGRDEIVWLAGYASRQHKVFYQMPGDDDWQRGQLPGIVGLSDQVRHLHVDVFNQKWISLESSIGEGRGILVWNTGKNVSDVSDDEAFIMTTDIDRGFLPDPFVNVMRSDQRGEVWVGTRRGVVRYVFPDRIIRGSAADRRAEYLRSTNNDSLLLRDFNVRDIQINAANQKWIATADNGAWLVSQNGDRILANFTAENSPLPSNDVISIGIDDQTGEVYFATSAGLVSFVAEVKSGSASMNQLKVFPNPYSYQRNSADRIFIEGLTDETTLRIITPDGRLVRSFESRGGRVSWDARDQNGRNLATGVYLVVALDANGGQRGIGKVLIVN